MRTMNLITSIVVVFALVGVTACVEEDVDSADDTTWVEQALERTRPAPVRRPATLRPDAVERIVTERLRIQREQDARPQRPDAQRPTRPQRPDAERPSRPEPSRVQPGDIDIALGEVFISEARGRGLYNVTVTVASINYTRFENLYSAFTLNNQRAVLASARLPIEQSRVPNTFRVVFQDVALERGAQYSIIADPSNLIDETNERNNGLRFGSR